MAIIIYRWTACGALPPSLALALQAIMREVLLNTELIAVNQDAGPNVGASRVAVTACAPGAPQSCQLWHKTNSTGAHFVAVYNPNGAGTRNGTFAVPFAALGLPPGTAAAVRDLWAHADMGVFTDSYTATEIAPFEARTLRIVAMGA